MQSNSTGRKLIYKGVIKRGLDEILQEEKKEVKALNLNRIIEFKMMFAYYDYLSKYEHLGDLTLWMVGRGFKEKDNIQSFEDLLKVLLLIFASLTRLLAKFGESLVFNINNLIDCQNSLADCMKEYLDEYGHLQPPLPEI